MKWLKPNEVKNEGTYLIHRIDDEPIEDAGQFPVVIVNIDPDFEGDLYFKDEINKCYLWELAEEYRFFGPLPECK